MAAATAPPQQVQAGWSAPPPAPVQAAPSSGGAPTIATIAGGAVASPAAAGYFVQTGSFSTADNAERQRGVMRTYGMAEISQGSAGGRDVYRVRLGPYTTSDAAGIVADRLKRSGYGDARVVAD
ncbi:MAG: SPOR domain-containing protein [Alphaproteobacteria bacterium]|nr:SPOR domain-containing protein [Alphaproteobacteria bacterium]